MYTGKTTGDRSHNDHGNSAAEDINKVKQENPSKFKPGEPVDIIGTGSNYLESDLISAPDEIVERIKDQEDQK